MRFMQSSSQASRNINSCHEVESTLRTDFVARSIRFVDTSGKYAQLTSKVDRTFFFFFFFYFSSFFF